MKRRRLLRSALFSGSYLALRSAGVRAERPLVLTLANADNQIWMDLLGYARWSPSPHNLQPWKFKATSSLTAEIYYDPSRLLPVADPETKFLVMALAIFIEYLDISAGKFNLELKTSYLGEKLNANANGPQLFARLDLVERANPCQYDPNLILARRTSRLPYDGIPVHQAAIDQFKSTSEKFGHSFNCTEDGELIEWIHLINETALFNDLGKDDIRSELIQWLRYQKSDASAKKDGLWSKCMCFPGWFMKSFFENPDKYMAEKKRARLRKIYLHKMRDTATTGWISGPFATFDHWINCGKLLARVWLDMTRNNVYIHPFGSVITDPESHESFARKIEFDETETQLWFLFRMGGSDVPSGSYRLDLNDLIL